MNVSSFSMPCYCKGYLMLPTAAFFWFCVDSCLSKRCFRSEVIFHLKTAVGVFCVVLFPASSRGPREIVLWAWFGLRTVCLTRSVERELERTLVAVCLYGCWALCLSFFVLDSLFDYFRFGSRARCLQIKHNLFIYKKFYICTHW